MAASGLRKKQEHEHQLWQQWSKAEDPAEKQKHVDEFFVSFEPRLKSWRRRLSNSTLPGPVIDTELATRALNAFEKYDPTKGAQINTWIDSNLRGVYRWTLDHQNLGRIPSHRHAMIGTFKQAQTELEERLGRPPSAAEIADEMVTDLTSVEKLQKELRKDIHLTDEIAVNLAGDQLDSDFTRVLDLIYYELSPEEQVVYEYWFGRKGKEKISGNAIATKIRKSPSAVSEIKGRIREKMKYYLDRAEMDRLL
jgi:DNA-directed RNA polymerase specialized sigma subunit